MLPLPGSQLGEDRWFSSLISASSEVSGMRRTISNIFKTSKTREALSEPQRMKQFQVTLWVKLELMVELGAFWGGMRWLL